MYAVFGKVEFELLYIYFAEVENRGRKPRIRLWNGFEELQKVFLCPASFIRRKNQQEIISFLRGRVDENFVILFAGTGICEEECKVLVGDDSRFRFLEFQMEVL